MKINHESTSTSSDEATNPMDKLLAKLSEQTAALSKQHEALKASDDIAYTRTVDYISCGGSSVPITPATEGFQAVNTAPVTNTSSIPGETPAELGDDEVLRLKMELEAAKGKIARMDQELAQSRITKHTIDQVIGSTVSEADFSMGQPSEPYGYTSEQGTISARPQYYRDNSWGCQQDDAGSDTSDALSAGGFNRARNIWSNGASGAKPSFGSIQGPGAAFQPSQAMAQNEFMNRGFGQPFIDTPMQFQAPVMADLRGERFVQSPGEIMLPPIGPRRNNNPAGRFNSRPSGSNLYASSNSSYDGFTPGSTSYGSIGMGVTPQPQAGLNMSNSISNGMYSGYQPQPIGTPLSPHAPEFTANPGWKAESVSDSENSIPFIATSVTYFLVR